MHKRDLNEGRTGTLLTGLGLLTAAGFVALSFAKDATGAAPNAAAPSGNATAAIAPAPEATPVRAGLID